MADLVMTVDKASAKRQGGRIVVQASGEKANSRDDVYVETSTGGSTVDVYVRTRPAGGMGTEITGPFSASVTIENADNMKSVRVHGRNGTKTINVP